MQPERNCDQTEVMEHLIPSLKICQKLKELGFPQNTVFSWQEIDGPEFESVNGPLTHYVVSDARHDEDVDIAMAPTAQEIADNILSKDGNLQIEDHYGESQGYLATSARLEYRIYGSTLAEALAALWIALREEELF